MKTSTFDCKILTDSNVLRLQNQINRLGEQGYDIESHQTNLVDDGNTIFHTVIMVKRSFKISGREVLEMQKEMIDGSKCN